MSRFSERDVTAGDVYEGQDHYRGMRVRVLAVVPGDALYDGKAKVLIESHAQNALSSVQASIDYARKFQPKRAEALYRYVTEPREDVRELQWFTNWVHCGHLKRVEHGHGLFLLGFTAGYSKRNAMVCYEPVTEPERSYLDGHEQGRRWRAEDDRQNAVGLKLVVAAGHDPDSLELIDVISQQAQRREREALTGTLVRL